MQSFQPEILQGLVSPGFAQEAPRSYLDLLRQLMSEIVERHADTYPGDDNDWASASENAVTDHFAQWGSGWYENSVFLLHAFTYDDTCLCGAWSKEPDPRLSQIALYDESPELVRARLCTCDDGWSDVEPLERIFLPPNFLYKPSLSTSTSAEPGPIAVNWYKHLHRSASISAQLSRAGFRSIIEHCIASLETEPTVCVAARGDWPTVIARKQAYEQLITRVLELPEPAQTVLLTAGDE